MTPQPETLEHIWTARRWRGSCECRTHARGWNLCAYHAGYDQGVREMRAYIGSK